MAPSSTPVLRRHDCLAWNVLRGANVYVSCLNFCSSRSLYFRAEPVDRPWHVSKKRGDKDKWGWHETWLEQEACVVWYKGACRKQFIFTAPTNTVSYFSGARNPKPESQGRKNSARSAVLVSVLGKGEMFGKRLILQMKMWKIKHADEGEKAWCKIEIHKSWSLLTEVLESIDTSYCRLILPFERF